MVGLGNGRTRGFLFCVEIFILFFSKWIDKEKEKTYSQYSLQMATGVGHPLN